jgi:hypothetical protein
MASKSKKKIIIAKKQIARKCKPKKTSSVNARRCVSQRAPCSDEQCPMRLILFLTNNNQWYLHTSSCLSHRHHPHLGEHAILLSQKDLSDKEQKLINVVDDETTQFLVHMTKRINVDGLFISRGITGVFDSQHGGVRDSRMCRGDMIILQLKKGHKIKPGNDVTCIVCLCVGRKAFFLETEFTNRETIIVAIADSSPIVGFRGREAYEVSEYAIIRFGNNQFV